MKLDLEEQREATKVWQDGEQDNAAEADRHVESNASRPKSK